MTKRTSALLLPIALLNLCIGCETGHEVASVQSATATRDAQDRVAVHTELGCFVAWGMGRASSVSCDADNTNVCVRANWYDRADTKFERSLFEGRACAEQKAIIGAKVDLTSGSAIPKSPSMKIRVQTEVVQEHATDSVATPVTIDSP